MTFTKSQEKLIESMISKGEPMYKIAEKLGNGCSWVDIQNYCWETGTMSWQGSKKIISNCLKKLPLATKQQDREEYAETIRKNMEYLYYLGKQMRDRVIKIEKAVDKFRI